MAFSVTGIVASLASFENNLERTMKFKVVLATSNPDCSSMLWVKLDVESDHHTMAIEIAKWYFRLDNPSSSILASLAFLMEND